MEIDKVENRIERLFPKYFENFTLPEGAIEEEIIVYRACKTQICDKESFTPTFEEKGFKYSDDDEIKDPSLYSLSVYEKPNHIKRFVTMNSDYEKPYKIAIGVTKPCCGIVQRTKERKKKAGSHVDWWLYENAKPYEYFEIIDDFKNHVENMKKGD